MRLLYNDNSPISGLTSQSQFNGNISGIVVNRKDNNGSGNTTFGYGFQYDALNRLISSDYGQSINFATNHGKYSEFGITYDLNGNIRTLKRSDAAGLMDDLTYTYTSTNSNQLLKVDDASSTTLGFKDVTGNDYSYDPNGNLTKDLNKGMATISYNLLNLPDVLSKDVNNSIRYTYSASGMKLCKEAKVSGVTSKRYYAGAFEYDDAKQLAMLHTDEGLVELTRSSGNTTYSYEYFLKDHLGNTRILFSSTGSVLQRNDYYPFGMTANQYSSSTDNKYLYNGKELQQELGVDWYDYGARFYDSQIGRWLVIDNKAKKYFSVSQYVYALNNSIKFIDPDGNDVQVSFTDKTHEAALKNLLSTEEGRAFVGRYMKANTELYGYKFSKNGDRANDLLVLKSAEMYNQNDPNGGGKIGDDHTYTKDGQFYANDAQSENEVLGGFREVIRLDIGLNEIDATIALGHEAFVHADKAADKLTQINEKIKAGGYKKFEEIVRDLESIVKSGKKDHESLKKGEVKKFENFSKKLAKEKKNEQYNKKYEEDKSNPNL